jgi:hypothetical protein
MAALGWLATARGRARRRARRLYSARIVDPHPAELEEIGFMDPELREFLNLRRETPASRQSAFVLKWVRWGKAKFPILEFTEANYLMVAEELRKALTLAGVRDVWVAHHVPTLAAQILIPSRAQLAGRRLFLSPEAQERLEEMEDHRSPNGFWSSLFGWAPILPSRR